MNSQIKCARRWGAGKPPLFLRGNENAYNGTFELLHVHQDKD